MKIPWRERARRRERARLAAYVSAPPLQDEPPDFDHYKPFTRAFPYEKRFYMARLPDGTCVKVWPNAWVLHSLDGSGRTWSTEAGVDVLALREDDE